MNWDSVLAVDSEHRFAISVSIYTFAAELEIIS